MINNVFKYLRTDDWLDSKVPFMISIAIIIYLYGSGSMSTADFYISLSAYFLYISMFLAFSYVINDFTDLEIDKLAGKQKVMFALSKPMIVVSMVVIAIIGILPMFLIVNQKGLYLGFTLLLYIAGSAYSVPWLLRFKERGITGLIECSIAQRCLPLIPLVFVFKTNWIFFYLVMLLSFINGMRYILIHQAVDYENDLKTGVKTFVSEGHNRYRLYIIISTIVECVLFMCIFAKICIDYPFIILVLIAYCAFEKVIATVVTKYMNVDLFCTFLAVPLESLYNVVFPIITALILAICSWKYIGILALVVILTFKCFKGKSAFVNVYIQSKRHKS